MAQIAADSEHAAPVAAAAANPAPLGLCGFAMTTFVLSTINAGWYAAGATTIVVGLALFYGGICQLLAGMWEFRAGNTFGATAFTSYGAFWLSFAVIFIPGFGILAPIPAAAVNTALGLYLLGWTIFTGLMFIATLRTNGALVAVFGFLFVTFLLLAIGKLGPNANVYQWGGYFGVATAILAWYTALAGVLASVKFPFELPVFPMS